MQILSVSLARETCLEFCEKAFWIIVLVICLFFSVATLEVIRGSNGSQCSRVGVVTCNIFCLAQRLLVAQSKARDV